MNRGFFMGSKKSEATKENKTSHIVSRYLDREPMEEGNQPTWRIVVHTERRKKWNKNFMPK